MYQQLGQGARPLVSGGEQQVELGGERGDLALLLRHALDTTEEAAGDHVGVAADLAPGGAEVLAGGVVAGDEAPGRREVAAAFAVVLDADVPHHFDLAGSAQARVPGQAEEPLVAGAAEGSGAGERVTGVEAVR